jgi:type II secretory pathway component PulJ
MKRVPAFTLIEGLASMLLLAVLASFVFVVLRTMQQGSLSFARNTAVRSDELWLEQALRADLLQATAVEVGPEGTIELRALGRTVDYRVLPDHVERDLNGEAAGHFPVHIAHAEVRTTRPGSETVRCIEWTVGDDGPSRTLVFAVEQDRSTLINDLHGHTDPD